MQHDAAETETPPTGDAGAAGGGPGDAGAAGGGPGDAGAAGGGPGDEMVPVGDDDGGLRIGDAASRVGLSTRTLRYYEELGLLTPSAYTAGGERRYDQADLQRLTRILELREILGMNLDEIKGFLDTEARLEEVRQAYRSRKWVRASGGPAQQRALLEEILRLNESLAEQLSAKLERMEAFRASLLASANRCRELLAGL
jgi:MerR family transcriptional regulator, repressor of the yfmOP operon